ncbi:hypothetical protein AL527_09955 [Pseudomonas fulva]|nr:hypothetical protein AL527_09955 [Pseudomonas fulva]
MDIYPLQLFLQSWFRVDTWHTRHPKDEERYLLALHVDFHEFGYSIAYGQFSGAIHCKSSEL